MFARHLSLVSSVKKTTHTSLTDAFIPELQLIISHRRSSYGGHTLVCLNWPHLLFVAWLTFGFWDAAFELRGGQMVDPDMCGAFGGNSCVERSLSHHHPQRLEEFGRCPIARRSFPKYLLLRLDVIWPMCRCLHESLGGWV